MLNKGIAFHAFSLNQDKLSVDNVAPGNLFIFLNTHLNSSLKKYYRQLTDKM